VFSSGLGTVVGTKRGDFLYSKNAWLFGPSEYYENNHFWTVGLPLKVQYFIRPHRGFGLHLEGFANLNSQRSFVGALISLRFGRVQKRE
jgi:hypothetical protein